MLTLAEIELAVDGLTIEQKRQLYGYLEQSFRQSADRTSPRHGLDALQIQTVQLGPLPSTNLDGDLLGEMLEDCP